MSNHKNTVDDLSELKDWDSEKIKKNLFLCEIKKIYPLRKLFFIGLTTFSYYLIIDIVIKVCDKVKHGFRIFPDDLLFYILVIIFSIVISKYTFKYIKEKYKCIPVISRYFSRKQLKSEIALENFSPIDDFKGSDFYNKLLIGKDWICINNQFVYTKAVSMVGIVESDRGSGSRGTRTDYYLFFTYFTGETSKIFIDTKLLYQPVCELECDRRVNFEQILKKIFYDAIGINGIYITSRFEKKYYKYISPIQEYAKRNNIKFNGKELLENSIKQCSYVNEIVHINIPEEDRWYDI